MKTTARIFVLSTLTIVLFSFLPGCSSTKEAEDKKTEDSSSKDIYVFNEANADTSAPLPVEETKQVVHDLVKPGNSITHNTKETVQITHSEVKNEKPASVTIETEKPRQGFIIQLGAFSANSKAVSVKLKLEKKLGMGLKVEYTNSTKLYSVFIDNLKNKTQVNNTIKKLKQKGVTEYYVK